MGWLYDFVKDQASGVHHEDWFALYRDDGQIDDYTVINGVRRGNFRIHPNGSWPKRRLHHHRRAQ